MAEGKLTLEVVTPRGMALREIVDDVAVPSVEGEFGVLPGHLPMLAAIRTGIVTFHKGGEQTRVAVADGFAEVRDDRVLLLTDRSAQRDQVDPVAVRLELKDVDQKLSEYAGSVGGADWQALVSRELWAAVQLELYGDPPPATRRPYEAFGPPAPPEESEVEVPPEPRP